MEKKQLPQFTESINDRTVTGIFAVHGHVDDGSDRSHPGAFLNTAVNGRSRTKFLWMHDRNTPPIARIDSFRELNRAELPEKVLSYAPDATGGVEVTRTYNASPLAEWVLMGIKDGSIDEMSYAYIPTRFDFEETDDRQIRNLRELKLFDISDVNWGEQEATLAAKSGLESGLPFEQHIKTVVSTVDELVDRFHSRWEARQKSGRRFSAVSIQEMESGIDQIMAGMARIKGLIESATPVPEKSLHEDLLRLRSASTALRRTARDLGVQV